MGAIMKTKRNNGGFTILELLITIIILTVAMLALASLQTTSISANYSSHRMTIATILAQDKLEELWSLAAADWSNAQLQDTVDNYTIDNDGDGTNDDFNWTLNADHTNVEGLEGIANPIDEFGNNVTGTATTGYTREWNVAVDKPTDNMKTISVRVSWQDKKARSVIITSVISSN